jgi:hypothetical protein
MRTTLTATTILAGALIGYMAATGLRYRPVLAEDDPAKTPEFKLGEGAMSGASEVS